MGKTADVKKIPDKLTDSQRKQKKNDNKDKGNHVLAAEKLEKIMLVAIVEPPRALPRHLNNTHWPDFIGNKVIVIHLHIGDPF